VLWRVTGDKFTFITDQPNNCLGLAGGPEGQSLGLGPETSRLGPSLLISPINFLQ